MQTSSCMRAVAIVLMVASIGQTRAQHPSGDFQELAVAIGRTPTASALVDRPRLQPRRIPRDISLTDRLRLIDRPVVVMPDGRGMRVPLDLNVITSRDQKTVVQFGDALMRMHPVRMDLFWIDNNGKVRSEIRDRFDGSAILDMSRDGYVAVVGRPFLSEIPRGEPATKDVVVYNPDGKALMAAEIDAKTQVSSLLSLPRGSGALLAVAPIDDPLGNNQLLVLRDGTLRQLPRQPFGILQKLVDLDRDAMVFVQGSEAYGLVDAAEGEVIWLQPGGIRLVGPAAATLTPSGERLLLMTGLRTGADAQYEWAVTVLDSASGKALGQQRIDGLHPGTADPVFTDLTPRTATIAPSGRKMQISIRPR